jgi:hypothetical protein
MRRDATNPGKHAAFLNRRIDADFSGTDCKPRDIHRTRGAHQGMTAMPSVDREAPLHFLRTAYEPDDWIAVFLKSYETGRTAQRVGPVAMVADVRFRAWLRWRNLLGSNVCLSECRPPMEAITNARVGARNSPRVSRRRPRWI